MDLCGENRKFKNNSQKKQKYPIKQKPPIYTVLSITLMWVLLVFSLLEYEVAKLCAWLKLGTSWKGWTQLTSLRLQYIFHSLYNFKTMLSVNIYHVAMLNWVKLLNSGQDEYKYSQLPLYRSPRDLYIPSI